MKKWISMILFILVSLSFSGCINKKEEIKTKGDYYITGSKDVVKVREKADDESKVITKLDNGENVQLVETGEEYFKIYVPAEDEVGYLSKYYLTNDKDAVSEPLSRYAKDDILVYSLPKDDASKIGTIKKGNEVTLMASLSDDYAYIYEAESTVHGYVKKDDLSEEEIKKEETTSSQNTPAQKREVYYSHVQKGYLALRTAPVYDYANEIASLYNDTQVEVIDKSNGTYWWVYVPSIDKEGYVNADYLYNN